MKSKFLKAVLAVSASAAISIASYARAEHAVMFDESTLQKFIYRANLCLAAYTVTDDCMRAAETAGNMVRYQLKPVRYPDLWLAPGELADFQRAIMTSNVKDFTDARQAGQIRGDLQAYGFSTQQAARIASWMGETGGLDKLCKMAIVVDPVAGRSVGCGTL